MNTFELGCASISTAAYIEGRNARNQTPAPLGATRLPGPFGYASDSKTSFEARADEYQGRIAITFAGTDFSQVGDLLATGGLRLWLERTRQNRGLCGPNE